MEQILPHWLTKQAALSPNKTAIEMEDGSTCTFQELKTASESFARNLAGLGVREQTRVSILSSNHLDMAVALFGLSYVKAIAVMLNIRLSNTELSCQLNASESELLIITEELYEKKQLSFDNQRTFAEIKAQPEATIQLTDEIELNAPFTMMFTSGTTGNPKTVIHTYGNHWWSAIGSALNLGLHKNDKWLLALPIFHVGGLSILLKSVIYGMEVHLMKRYDPKLFYEALTTKNITIASVVTLMLHDTVQLLGKGSLPNHVRCLLLGGGSVPKPLLNQIKQKQLPLFQSYGMTETSSQIATLSAEDTLTKIGSAGKPLFPAQLQINDENVEGIGEIIVKGPMVIDGYDRNPIANEKDFSDGWFNTGDLGYIDSDGFLFVVERRTDLIISGGENIYPREIENTLLEINEVEEVAVVGKSDVTWGQVPVVFVVIKNGRQLSTEDILAHLRERAAAYKIPKEVYFINELPRNASRKIMRHQLKKRL